MLDEKALAVSENKNDTLLNSPASGLKVQRKINAAN